MRILFCATLNSVFTQDFTDYEVIVVDDGSTDGTLELLRDYPNIKLLRQMNQGPGVARNYGVKEASGSYIAFLDSDDLWFPWTLSTFLSVLEKHGMPDLIAARMIEFWQDSELDSSRPEALRVEEFKDYFESSKKGYFVGACMMILRKQAFQNVGGFTEKRVYAEDCDLAIRLGVANGFVQILAPVTLAYRQHGSNARRNLALIYKGIVNLIDSELEGKYPGGDFRADARTCLITLHVRPVCVECIHAGEQLRAWKLYFRTFFWHIKARRWKYILGFPLLALAQLHRGWGRRANYLL